MRVLVLAAVLVGCAGSAQTADLSTPAGFLQAFQSASAAGDMDQLEALGLDVASYRNNVVAGGEWHDRVMATTLEDVDLGYDTYWIVLWEDLPVDDSGEGEGSNVSCGLEVVDGGYHIAGCIAAG